jgi:hypothetical protein
MRKSHHVKDADHAPDFPCTGRDENPDVPSPRAGFFGITA